jgi:hypothetical protein
MRHCSWPGWQIHREADVDGTGYNEASELPAPSVDKLMEEVGEGPATRTMRTYLREQLKVLEWECWVVQ